MTFKTPILVAAVLSMAGFQYGCVRDSERTAQSNVIAREDLSAAGRADSLESHGNDPGPDVLPAPDAVSAYVRRIFQDSKGNLWIGTNSDGVARYNGDTLEYFSVDKGLGGRAVRGIVEDHHGDVWFGTSGGLTKFDGTSFTNFTMKDGLIGEDVWYLMIDSKRTMWIGADRGFSRYDGNTFTSSTLPASQSADGGLTFYSPRVMCITEDSNGDMWFAAEGVGAYMYDDKSFRQFTDKDGLSDNNVSCILEDRRGTIWFSTMWGGVNTFDGRTFTNLTKRDYPSGIEVWNLYEDREGNIWFPGEGAGLFRYDGKTLTKFNHEQGLDSRAIQCTHQDRAGRLWAGGYLGLYRLDGESFVKVSKNGPWD